MSHFINIYHLIFGDTIYKEFIYALKYQKITVLQQFQPEVIIGNDAIGDCFQKQLLEQYQKYGENTVIISDRIPKNDFEIIDRTYFDEFEFEFTNENLINKLFYNQYLLLGVINLNPLANKLKEILSSDNN